MLALSIIVREFSERCALAALRLCVEFPSLRLSDGPNPVFSITKRLVSQMGSQTGATLRHLWNR